jgi:hypothetical protein
MLLGRQYAASVLDNTRTFSDWIQRVESQTCTGPWPLMELDFAISGPLVQPRMPHIRFLFVRSRLCSTLPSDATSR